MKVSPCRQLIISNKLHTSGCKDKMGSKVKSLDRWDWEWYASLILYHQCSMCFNKWQFFSMLLGFWYMCFHLECFKCFVLNARWQVALQCPRLWGRLPPCAQDARYTWHGRFSGLILQNVVCSLLMKMLKVLCLLPFNLLPETGSHIQNKTK